MKLQNMRDKSGSFVFVFLFAIIIIVFIISFGPGSKGFNASQPYAAKVNGQKVSTGEWSFHYNNLFSSYQRFDPDFNNEKAEQYNLKGIALNSIVDSILLAQTGENIGLSISQGEVGRDIVSLPSFKENNRFDKDLYKKMVNYYYKMSVSRYEEKHRHDMVGSRVRDLLQNGLMVSENTVFDEWMLKSEKVNLDFVKFAASNFTAGIVLIPEDISSFEKNESDKIKTYFENHSSDYEKPEEVHARHILLKTDENSSKLLARQVAKKAKKLAEQAKAAPDTFADLASKNSEGPTKTKGGDLGFFSKGRMVKEFEEVAFALEVGQVSDPVKTRFGWHIIKVEEKKPADNKKLEDVSEAIARIILTKEKSEQRAKAKADEFFAAVSSGKSFEDTLPKAEDDNQDKANKNKLPTAKPFVPKIEQSGSFARTSGSYVPRIGASDEVYEAAWKLKQEKALASQVYKVGEAYFVIRLKEHKLPSKEEFAGESDKEIKATMSKLSSNAYSAWIKQARDSADIETKVGATLFQEEI